METVKDLEIQDIIPFIGSNDTVFYNPPSGYGGHGEWFECKVVGIDIVQNKVLLHSIEMQSFHAQWALLYSQRNSRSPKDYRIKLK